MQSTLFQGGIMDADQLHHASGTTAHILSIGDDPWLLISRQMVLESSGYEVFSCSSDALIKEELTLECDLAILCHSIEAERAQELANRLRRLKPSLPLLVLTYFESCSIRGLEGSVNSSNPGVLLEVILRMINVARSTPASGAIGHEVPRICTEILEVSQRPESGSPDAPRTPVCQNVHEIFRAASKGEKRRE
jgi:hypothetical protein